MTEGAGVVTGRPIVTRRDRRSHASRMHILDAAVRCLAEDGYVRSSTCAVQRRAGVSRGGLLHHFPSKDALLVAAAQHLASTRVAETATGAADFTTPDGSPERIDEAVAAMWLRFQEPYFRAATELWVAAAHNPGLREALEPSERRLGATIREVIAVMFGPTLSTRPGFPELRDMLVTSMRGVGLVDAFDGREARHAHHLAAWSQTCRAVLVPTRTRHMEPCGRPPRRPDGHEAP